MTSLRHLLLFIIAFFGFLVATAQFAFIVQSQSHEAQAQLNALVRHAGGTLAANLEAAVREGDVRFIDHLLAQQITFPNLIYAALVDADGRVLAGSAPGLRVGRLADSPFDVPPAELVADARRTLSAKLLNDREGKRLWGVFPVRLPAGGGEIRSLNAGYVVFLTDTAPQHQTALRQAMSQSIAIWLPILLLSAVIWFMLRVLLTNRIERLLSYIRSRAQDANAAPPVYGADELGQLGGELGCLMREVLDSRDFYAKLLNGMPNPIWRAGVDGRCNYFNQAWLDFTGRELADEIGEGWVAGVHPDDVERCMRTYGGALSERKAFVMEYRLRFNDGSYHCISDHGEPIFSSDGDFVGYVGSCYDLQQIKSASAAVAASEERFRVLVENTLAGVFTLSDGCIQYANPRLLEWLQYDAESIAGVSVTTLVHPEDAELAEELVRRRERDDPDGRPHMLRARRKDGSYFFVEVYGTRLEHQTGPMVIGTVLDVSERERALSALTVASEVIEASPTILFRWKLEPGWPVFFVSENIHRWGYSSARVLSPTFSFASLIHPDDVVRVEQEVLAYFAARTWDYVQEYRIRKADGEYIWIEDLTRVSVDDEGTPRYCEGLVTDISARKLAEERLEQLNAELEARVERRTTELALLNKELETFAYSVSHDLKAPLRGIDGYSHLLMEDYGDRIDGDGRTFIANIRAGVKQMARLIDDLLAYSRMERRALQRTDVSLAVVVHGILAEYEGSAEMAQAKVSIDVPDMTVKVDPGGLEQVMRNLLGNALKYSSNAMPPRIDIVARKEGEWCHLYVSDNGIGFDMKFHDRIFEIFQRLQRAEDYAGTGVGLAIVRKAMQRMGGRVWAESAPGEGARFHLLLPT